MKRGLLFIVLFSSVLCVAAQDIILTKNGVKIEAKILVVGESVVKYQFYDEKQGTAYQYLPKKDIEYIKYEDGKYQTDFGNKTEIDEKKYNDYKEYTNKENKNTINQKNISAALALKKKGGIFLGAGLACTIVGSVLVGCASYNGLWYFENSAYNNPVGQLTCGLIGSVILIPAPVLVSFGVFYMATANIRLDDLNYGIALYSSGKTSLNMAYTGNGIGLKLKF